MTFKHIKFEDSEVMRSLEKHVVNKGDAQPVVKEASKRDDYTPTGSLTDNVLKLCAGMRKSGMDKYATQLEATFLKYKQAESLYETSKEKGEDHVHAAHPDGSHKLEGVEGVEATFEDILDQHLKMLDVADGTVKGKLDATQVIQSVLVALGRPELPATPEEIDDMDEDTMVKWRNWTAFQRAQSILTTLEQLKSTVGSQTNAPKLQKAVETEYQRVSQLLGTISEDSVPANVLDGIQASLTNINSALDAGGFSAADVLVPFLALRHLGDDEKDKAMTNILRGFVGKATSALAQARAAIRGALDGAIKTLLKSQQEQAAKAALKKQQDAEKKKQEEAAKAHAADPNNPINFRTQIMAMSQTFTRLISHLQTDDPKNQPLLENVKTWLGTKANALTALAAQFTQEVGVAADKQAVVQEYQGYLANYGTAFAQVRDKWKRFIV